MEESRNAGLLLLLCWRKETACAELGGSQGATGGSQLALGALITLTCKKSLGLVFSLHLASNMGSTLRIEDTTDCILRQHGVLFFYSFPCVFLALWHELLDLQYLIDWGEEGKVRSRCKYNDKW